MPIVWRGENWRVRSHVSVAEKAQLLADENSMGNLREECSDIGENSFVPQYFHVDCDVQQSE